MIPADFAILADIGRTLALLVFLLAPAVFLTVLVSHRNSARHREQGEGEPVGQGAGDFCIFHTKPYRLNRDQDHA